MESERRWGQQSSTPGFSPHQNPRKVVCVHRNEVHRDDEETSFRKFLGEQDVPDSSRGREGEVTEDGDGSTNRDVGWEVGQMVRGR